jgi:hypothetical protein
MLIEYRKERPIPRMASVGVIVISAGMIFFGNPQLQPGQADTYELRVKEDNNYSFHPDYPDQLAWTYEGVDGNGQPYHNPTFFARYGRPVIVRLHNELPKDHEGFRHAGDQHALAQLAYAFRKRWLPRRLFQSI